ncbi:hypothetical protein ACWDSD_28795 [Streptomyces spiralis]|uniref:hypothetical protein n=1 Tax=Streptomyces spiralis TaxID=66376 RepID=UPI003405A1B9
MNQRKNTYRAALQRRPDTTASAPAGASAPAPAPTTLTPLATRYVKVVVELDPALPRDLAQWIGQPLNALVRAGAAVLRPLRQNH